MVTTGGPISVNERPSDLVEVFNQERPHQALDTECPAERHRPSTRIYQGLPDIDCPLHDRVTVVTGCGRICLGKKTVNFSTVFTGQAVGIKEVHDGMWLVSFMDYDLRYFDLERRVLEPLENPLWPKNCYPCLGYVLSTHVSGAGPSMKWSRRMDLKHRPPGPEPVNKLT